MVRALSRAMNSKDRQNGQNGPNGQANSEPATGKAMSSPAAGRVYGQHSGYRKLRPKTLEQAAAWVNKPARAEPIEERAANLGAILATQAHWLTERLLDRQARDFEAGGGFTERLYRARTRKPPPTSPPPS